MSVVTQFEAVAAYGLPFALGVGVSYLTALVTRSHASSGVKLAVNAVLTLIAAAGASVPFGMTGNVGADLQAYGVALAIAFLGNVAAYLHGGSQVVERATWNRGLIGRKVVEPDAQMGQFADVDQSTQPE